MGSLLPADVFIIVNKTILTLEEKKLLTMLYQPIIGHTGVSLYFTLCVLLDKSDVMSSPYTHHHLMSSMKLKLNDIYEAREALEAVGLIKSYFKEGEVNNYIYELYSPISSYEFFNHPILNIVLYNNIGAKEHERIVNYFKLPGINLSGYTNITRSFNEVFESRPYTSFEAINEVTKKRNTNALVVKSNVDFDLLISSLPKTSINENTFGSEVRRLIINLSFIYDLGILELENIIRNSLNIKGVIDKNLLRKNARSYYQFENNGKIPNIIHRTQPEYLRGNITENSRMSKMIYTFETTSPYNFLKSKHNGAEPTNRDLRLLEILMIDYELKPGVVNVLIDYVMKTNNYKLTKAFVETIAGQWKRLGIEAVSNAIEVAKKEHKKYSKLSTNNKKTESPLPDWFNKKIEKENLSDEELRDAEDLLKEFR